MPTINAQDARALFTSMLIDLYRETVMPTSFLRSFFKTTESTTKLVSIEVERGFEKIAVDVTRGSEGNRNSFSRSTLKMFQPAYYREYFDATDLDLYERVFGAGVIDEAVFAQFMTSVADKIRTLQNTIDRSYELQCSQVFHTGIVELAAASNIDFKRKSDSLVDLGGGNYWDGASVDPNVAMNLAGNFIREKGKAQGGMFNVILGSSALNAFFNNDVVKERGGIVRYNMDLLTPAQRDSVGGVFHGEVSADSYRMRLWSYPEVYDNAANESTPYIDPKTMIVLPEKPRFNLAYAAVPQLLDENETPKQGAYLISEFKDKRNSAHIFDIKSAGVAVPVAVDQIWTGQVLA